MSETPQRRRTHYTNELKLKLIQLCVENGVRYVETTPEDDFWRYIRTLFVSISGCEGGDGGAIRRKVGGIVADRKAGLELRKRKSGVTVAAPTDLEKVTDIWIEWVARRGDEKQEKIAKSIQIKEERKKAILKRRNLAKTPLKKHTFQEVAPIDLTESDTIRDKRRKTGEAWASGKEAEMQERWKRFDQYNEQSLALTRDIFNAIMTPTPETAATSATPSATPAATTSTTTTAAASTTIAPPTTEMRLATIENQIHNIQQTQQRLEEAQIRAEATQREILRLVSGLQKEKQ